jgi:hypothetical protein
VQLLTKPFVATEQAGVAAGQQLGWLYRGPPARSGGCVRRGGGLMWL